MKSKINKSIASFAGICLLMQTFFPPYVFALTSGPSQPEFSSFESVAATDMVDLFTGDFSYNLPLLEVPGPRGGYPINLFYNSVTNMDQEASMVGLGWNIGIGAIQRNLKGVPDDFNGESLRHIIDRKNNTSVGIIGKAALELAPFDSGISSGLSLTGSLQATYNNYRGPGVTLGFGASIKFGESSSISPNFSSAFSTYEGADYSLGVSLAQGTPLGSLNVGLSTGFNTLTGSQSYNVTLNGVDAFPNPSARFPSLAHPRTSTSISMDFSMGPEIYTINLYGGVGGSYMTEGLKYKNTWRTSPMYGSMYLDEGQNIKNAVLDYTRPTDKPMFYGNKNLPAPISEEDLYSVSGHGMGGSFKIFRNDIGVFGGQSFKTVSGGSSSGFELGAVQVFRAGANLTVNTIKEENDFRSSAGFDTDLEFRNKTYDNEPYYFDFIYGNQSHLTATANSNPTELDRDPSIWGGDEPVFFKQNFNGIIQGELMTEETEDNESLSAGMHQNRKARSKQIQHFTNDLLTFDLLFGGGTSPQLITQPAHFDLSIYKHDGSLSIPNNLQLEKYERRINKQIGAFSITDESGSRWHYGLPVLNTVKKEVSFSFKAVDDETNNCHDIVDQADYTTNGELDHYVDEIGNEQHLQIREIPEYAHAHLLTSMMSHDYIDVDPYDGPPNVGDMGHWVRFEYVQTHDASTSEDSYKWRIPYEGAHFNGGMKSLDKDNKAFFTYGERQQYLPYRIYTATHYAQFEYSKREDARGAKSFLGDAIAGESPAYSYKVDKITLYRHQDGQDDKKIKSISFEYNAEGELCPGVLNNLASGGKLTLSKVGIENYDSARGSYSPYVFKYNNEGYSAAYDPRRVDRWGVFKPQEHFDCENQEFPYTRQTGMKDVLENHHRENVSLWHLESIELPSGSRIDVEVERDHYGYVQNEVATQMTKILGFGEQPGTMSINIPASGDNTADDLKICFELNAPIETANVNKELELRQYFEHLKRDAEYRQIVFQSNVEMKPGSGRYETFEGMCHIKDDLIFGQDFGFSSPVGTAYNSAWIQVVRENEKIQKRRFHPMLVGAWQFNKTYLRSEMSPVADIFENGEDGAFDKMTSILNDIPDLLTDYYKICIRDKYGVLHAQNKSFIRLNNPVKKKYGDGVRVKSVVIDDVWNATETNPAYGNIYDYEIDETISFGGLQDERRISSGVAVNEPTIGGIETAYRFYEQYTERLKNATDLLHFDFQPANEQYMPGAKVGYSEVRVRSLASEYHYQDFNDEDDLKPDQIADGIDPAGIASTGEARYSFYTAKDYPVLFKRSINHQRTELPISGITAGIGGYQKNIYNSTQGYVIELNDMHGKPKSVSHHGQKRSGEIIAYPTTSTSYEYFDEEKFSSGRIDGKPQRELSNSVDFIIDYKDGNSLLPSVRQGELGVTREMFTDIRKEKYSSNTTGIAAQIHSFLIPPVIFPVFPTGMPNIFTYSSKVETGVVNKIIRRKGIIKKVTTFDGQSNSEAENLAFDPYSGQAVLQRITNIYDENQFQYTIPAYQVYDRMGPASKNQGTCFVWEVEQDDFDTSRDECTNYVKIPVSSGPRQPPIGLSLPNLIQGDEFLVSTTTFNSTETSPAVTMNWTYMFEVNDFYYFHVDDFHEYIAQTLSRTPNDYAYRFEFNLVRSGNRNQLSAPAFEMTSLENPLTNGVSENKNWVFEKCDQQTENGTISVTSKEAVLDATAYEYEEFWHYVGDKPGKLSKTITRNDFQWGNLGVFRPEKTLKFVSERVNSETSKRGIYSNFYMHDWENREVLYVTDDNYWLPTQRITQYFMNGHVKEQQDQFGNFHANRVAYYNEDNAGVMSGSYSNCRYVEGGLSSFEEDEGGEYSLNFGHVIDYPNTTDDYNGYGGAYDVVGSDLVATNSQILFDKPASLINNGRFACRINYQNQTVILDEYFSQQVDVCNDDSQISFLGVNCIFDQVMPSNAYELDRIVLDERQRIFKPYREADNFVSTESHSGQFSYPIIQGKKLLDIRSIDMSPDKVYHVSFWASVPVADLSNSVFDLSSINFEANFIKGFLTQNPIGQFEATEERTASKNNPNVVWQKFEANLTFTEKPDAIKFDFDHGPAQVLIDDLCILPIESAISTNILDMDYLRPMESIDVNGYLTLYGYDADGDLVNIKKETGEGIFTIQEQKKFIVEKKMQ